MFKNSPRPLENSNCHQAKVRSLLIATFSMMAGCASSSASIEPPVPVPQVEPINDANETEESKVEESNPEVGESKKNQEDELNEGKKDNIYQKRRRFKGKKPWFLRSPADEQRRQERRNKRLKVVMNHRTRLLNYL